MGKKKAKLISKMALKEPREPMFKVLESKEKLFETVMNAIGDLVSIQDLNMRIAYQNKALKEVMGDHYGEYCYKIYERRDYICEGCPMQQSFKTGQIVKALRTGITKEGVERRYELITAPIKDNQGKIVAGIEVVRNVTRREQDLQEMDRIAKMLVRRDFELMEIKEKREKEIAELKKTKTELEEMKAVLEIKVRARTSELEELARNLEEQIKERTKELQKKVEDLERFYKLTVGRELKMVELKKEIARLKEELEQGEDQKKTIIR